jgi:hypothetical protein
MQKSNIDCFLSAYVLALSTMPLFNIKIGDTGVIIAHTRRDMIDEIRELSRREYPVTVILKVQKAGLILEKISNMLSRADDELIYELGRKIVASNTNRFLP